MIDVCFFRLFCRMVCSDSFGGVATPANVGTFDERKENVLLLCFATERNEGCYHWTSRPMPGESC